MKLLRAATLSLFVLFVAAGPVRAAETASPAAGDLKPMTWTIEGVERQGLVYVPASSERSAAKSVPSPLLFGFHGHGGTAKNAAQQFHLHQLWPEAVCVYLQGLNTPGRLTDPEGKKPGWQSGPGGQGDRDLKLFDAVLKDLTARYNIDQLRVYSTGHSNGGGFTYLLWRERGDVFAAVAPSSAAAPGDEWLAAVKSLKPKPVLHVAGRTDPLVKFPWQEATIDVLKKLDGCQGEGKKLDEFQTEFSSPSGTPVVAFIHPGGHTYPKEAPAAIVAFFKQHSKLTADKP